MTYGQRDNEPWIFEQGDIGPWIFGQEDIGPWTFGQGDVGPWTFEKGKMLVLGIKYKEKCDSGYLDEEALGPGC